MVIFNVPGESYPSFLSGQLPDSWSNWLGITNFTLSSQQISVGVLAYLFQCSTTFGFVNHEVNGSDQLFCTFLGTPARLVSELVAGRLDQRCNKHDHGKSSESLSHPTLIWL